MFKQVLKLGVLVMLVSLAASTVQGAAGHLGQVPVAGITDQEEQDLLQRATVQLVLFSTAGPSEAVGREVIRTSFGHTGLGTLVAFGGNTYLLTHDHWGDLGAVIRAEILTFDGRPVGEVPGDDLRRWILYRDGGTMVLSLPIFLVQSQGLRPAELGPSGTVQAGDVLLVAHQDPEAPGGVAFLQAEVLNQAEEAGLEAIKLRSLAGEAIVRGDSGGGVWLDGRLVGNNWKTDVWVVWWLALIGNGQSLERQRDTSLAAGVSASLLDALEQRAAAASVSEAFSRQNCLIEAVC